jgi:hypothetical protein
MIMKRTMQLALTNQKAWEDGSGDISEFWLVWNTCIAFSAHTEAAMVLLSDLFVTVLLCRYLSTLIPSSPINIPKRTSRNSVITSAGGSQYRSIWREGETRAFC